MNEDQKLLIKLFTLLGATSLAERASEVIPDAFTSDDFMSGIESLVTELERKSHTKVIEFSDEHCWRIQKFNIKTFRSGESVEGYPTIVINEFMPDTGKGGIGERTLYYDSEELRDEDIRKLCFNLN